MCERIRQLSIDNNESVCHGGIVHFGVSEQLFPNSIVAYWLAKNQWPSLKQKSEMVRKITAGTQTRIS